MRRGLRWWRSWTLRDSGDTPAEAPAYRRDEWRSIGTFGSFRLPAAGSDPAGTVKHEPDETGLKRERSCRPMDISTAQSRTLTF